MKFIIFFTVVLCGVMADQLSPKIFYWGDDDLVGESCFVNSVYEEVQNLNSEITITAKRPQDQPCTTEKNKFCLSAFAVFLSFDDKAPQPALVDAMSQGVKLKIKPGQTEVRGVLVVCEEKKFL